MKIEYIIDENDFLRYHLYSASKSARINKTRKRNRIIIPVLYAIFAAIVFYWQAYTVAIAMFIAGILWFFFYPIYEKRRYFKHYMNFVRENYKNRLERIVTFEIDSDYIYSRDEWNDNKIQKSEIESITEIKDDIFVKLLTGHSIVLPKGAIGNIEELKSTLKELAFNLGISYTKDLNWEWK